jgi:hypothetical protein
LTDYTQCKLIDQDGWYVTSWIQTKLAKAGTRVNLTELSGDKRTYTILETYSSITREHLKFMEQAARSGWRSIDGSRIDD